MSNLQEDLRKVFKSMYNGYDFPYDKINDLITKIGGAVAADSYADFANKFPNRASSEEWLAQTFDQWRKNEIMRLMQAQQNEQLKVGRLINNARDEGVAFGNMVKAYTGNQARKHAVFEMRNASANLNAVIDKNRMQEAGIDCYRWRTGNDEKVRDTHREMQNKICRFDDPSVFYDEKTKTWVPRTGDMVHKHPGEDYNCRCTASPYLMEIDEKTGKYGKGTDDPEDIEEILQGEETEKEKIMEDWLAELKASPDYVDYSRKDLNMPESLDDVKFWDTGQNKPYVEEFLEALRIKINSNPELRTFMRKNKINFTFAKGMNVSDGKDIFLDITCWFSGNRLKSKEMRFFTTMHELMHVRAGRDKNYAVYMKNLYKATQVDFKKLPEFDKIIESAKTGGKGLDIFLQKHWELVIKKNFELGSKYVEQGISGIADYTHGVLAQYMNAEQIETLDLRAQIGKAVHNVKPEIDLTQNKAAAHSSDYYQKNDRIELMADEFQANMGSVYFTNRPLFHAYKELLPNAVGLVENYIKKGKYK